MKNQNNSLDRLFTKYFKKNKYIPLNVPKVDCACVIPAWNEEHYLPLTIEQLLKVKKDVNALIIVVLNHPVGADPEPQLRTLKYLESLNNQSIVPIYAPNLTGGVGEARKLGMDSFLYSQGENFANKIIFSLDADTLVEEDYFSSGMEPFKDKNVAGAVLGYLHQEGNTIQETTAIRKYEDYLKYYVDNLRKANSPYAFHTIGSTFVVRGSDYLRCGGMRVKKAGEDFYFLQALSKIGTIANVEQILCHPSCRVSNRVPFGTGPSMKSLLDNEELSYIPLSCFEELKNLLSWANEDKNLLNVALSKELLSNKSQLFLEQEKFFSTWDSTIANQPDIKEARIKAFHIWFDGLKTLRFLHFMMK
jgi:glycosyltransferase involved in cell wall biosynthesis